MVEASVPENIISDLPMVYSREVETLGELSRLRRDIVDLRLAIERLTWAVEAREGGQAVSGDKEV